MTSTSDAGKCRHKTNLNPTSSTTTNINNKYNQNSQNLEPTNSTVPSKPPRRSSLAVGFLTGRSSEKNSKRRSSIAVSLLGKKDSSKLRKESYSSYETFVKSEKSDGLSQSPELIFQLNHKSLEGRGKVIQINNLTKIKSTANHNVYSTENNKEVKQLSSLNSFQNLDNTLENDKTECAQQKYNYIQKDVTNGNNSNTNESDNCDAENSSINSEITTRSNELEHYSSANSHNNQKRHSWWNIFIRDHLKQRSKSRSVDHGLSTSVDLDSLRSKVEGRIEYTDPLSKENEKKKTSFAVATTVYIVDGRDTLTSVAARFDTTPSELTQLNRLTSSFIYPGQQLVVPDKLSKYQSATTSKENDNENIVLSSTTNESNNMGTQICEEKSLKDEKDVLEGLRPGSPKPGHIKRISQAKDRNLDPADDPIITQRFLKIINVRHITDGQGVVGGVLLVTPNAIMFDPDVSDPLAIEHGPEHYGVIVPMELVVNVAIFHDIAHMRITGGESSNVQVAIYYPNGCNPLGEECSTSHKEGKIFSDAKDTKKAVDCEKRNDDNLQSQLIRLQIECEDKEKKSDKIDEFKINPGNRTLEERRRSMLDHHWAIPSKDRLSSEDEELPTVAVEDKVNSENICVQSSTVDSSGISQTPGVQSKNVESQLSNQLCYDSGIDICDPNIIPTVQPTSSKKIYSDADIVLSSDWVPPRTISPTQVHDSSQGSIFSDTNTLSQTRCSDIVGAACRKKTSSVSFSVDDNEQSQIVNQSSEKQTIDQNKKNKMLKRLSYPLTWVEGLTGEGGKSSDTESAPNTGDSNQSVFSKVFSSSPITLVSEFGGNLFLSKTPSEESGGSPAPPLTPHFDGHIALGRSSIATLIKTTSEGGEGGNTSLKESSIPKLNKSPPVHVQPKLDYRSMVSIDDKPDLFVSLDKLIPRPARACSDPPLYLRLRIGKPIGKTIPFPTSVMSYGKNKLKPEYWFSVPKNRIDELYKFVNVWNPHLYGEIDEEAIKERGFELIQHDTEWELDALKEGRQGSDTEDITELTRESWELLKAPYVKVCNVIKTVGSYDLDLLGGEVLSINPDEYKKGSLFMTGSFDLDFPIPDLIGETEILTEEHREKLCGHLPARAEGYSWTLAFSTSQHGFSLNSLYRKMQKLESPILIVIEDTNHNVFGALTSCSLHVSDHFYGTGESFLYKFNPTFKVFHWTGENMYFIKGNSESLSIGAGDGKFGLWLDGDINLGRTQSCDTYGNEPLAPQEDFVVKTFECWAFV